MDAFPWRELLSWYRQVGRSFPWRTTKCAFQILVAELLLQQTNVAKVVPVYVELIKRYPDAVRLREAPQDELAVLIEPLGLRYKVRRLKTLAEEISTTFGGHVPRRRSDLLSLPGVGPYIADAVLCYAFRERTVPVDTNIVRLGSRIFGYRSRLSRPRMDPSFGELFASTLPGWIDPREANWALLDLAHLMCTVKKPRCWECPVSAYCKWSGLMEGTDPVSA